jgi:hypothetical protein
MALAVVAMRRGSGDQDGVAPPYHKLASIEHLSVPASEAKAAWLLTALHTGTPEAWCPDPDTTLVGMMGHMVDSTLRSTGAGAESHDRAHQSGPSKRTDGEHLRLDAPPCLPAWRAGAESVTRQRDELINQSIGIVQRRP